MTKPLTLSKVLKEQLKDPEFKRLYEIEKKKDSKTKSQLNCRIAPEIKRKLDIESAKQGIRLGELVEKLCREGLKVKR